MCLMAICMSPLDKRLLILLPIFLLGCLLFVVELYELFVYFQTTIWGCEKVQKFHTEIQRIIENKILGEIKIHSEIMTSVHETQEKGN